MAFETFRRSLGAAVCGVPRSWTRLKRLSSSRARRVIGASLVALVVENPPANEETEEVQVRSLGWEDPWNRKWHPTSVLLPGKSHGRRSLAGFSPWVAKSWTRLSTWAQRDVRTARSEVTRRAGMLLRSGFLVLSTQVTGCPQTRLWHSQYSPDEILSKKHRITNLPFGV